MTDAGPVPPRGAGLGFFGSRRVLNLFAVLIVLGAAALALVMYVQASIAFPRPPPAAQRPGALAAAGGEALWLDVGGNRVEAWLLPARSNMPSPLIIAAHGNGELIDWQTAPMHRLREAGISVLLVEYPGYGRSGGRPSQTSITAALVAAYDCIEKDQRFDGARIVGYGRSLGGGAIAQLALHRRLAALVLESSFSSMADIARAHGLPNWLVLNRFDTHQVLAEFPRPILLLHGARDEIIPVQHMHALWSRSPIDRAPAFCRGSLVAPNAIS
jgi:pimeloyl-ACP methyl ester carboxylesterase